MPNGRPGGELPLEEDVLPVEEGVLPVEEAGAEVIPGEAPPTAGGSVITPSIEEMPELEGFGIGDQVNMLIRNITDEGIYELEIMPREELVGEVLPDQGEGEGRTALTEALI